MLSKNAKKVLCAAGEFRRLKFSPILSVELAAYLRMGIEDVLAALQELEEAGHVDLVEPMLTRCA